MAGVGCVKRLGSTAIICFGLAYLLGTSSAQAQITCAPSARTARHAYDALGRLIGTCNTGTGVRSVYTYDKAGNRSNVTIGLNTVANYASNTVRTGAATTINSNITGGAATSVNTVSVARPSHGTVAVSGVNLVNTSSSGVGLTTSPSDRFQHIAFQGSWTSPPATVTALPIAGAIPHTVEANSQFDGVKTININAMSVIRRGPPASVAIASGFSYGTATVSGLIMSYTPANVHPVTGNSAPDNFICNASKSVGASSLATLTETSRGASASGARLPTQTLSRPDALPGTRA